LQRNGDLRREEIRVLKRKALGIIMAIPKACKTRINKGM